MYGLCLAAQTPPICCRKKISSIIIIELFKILFNIANTLSECQLNCRSTCWLCRAVPGCTNTASAAALLTDENSLHLKIELFLSPSFILHKRRHYRRRHFHRFIICNAIDACHCKVSLVVAVAVVIVVV